jgi:hypothetical protein
MTGGEITTLSNLYEVTFFRTPNISIGEAIPAGEGDECFCKNWNDFDGQC